MVHSFKLGCVTFLVALFAICNRVRANVDFGPSYHDNCADYSNKDYICTVRAVQCDYENTTVDSNRTEFLDDAALTFVHDIRVEPYARAITRLAQQTYHLSVDISWQMPPNNSTPSLLAFILEIEDAAYNRSCFYFDILSSQWNSHLISTAPRFHFTSESLFEFNKAYDIRLRCLFKKTNHTAVLQKHVIMPEHPGAYKDTTTEHDCKRNSNPQASRWTGGFRRILVHPLARTIQVEFVGAPAHYCFDSYEVRLKDESGLELLHSAVVPVESMRVEHFDNQTVLFGEHNFTGLEVERYFIPSVIPVERSRDGRCLCPVTGTNPFDSRVVCSCIAADWDKVRIQRMEKPLAPGKDLSGKVRNDTFIPRVERSASGYIWTVLLTLVLLGVSMLVFFLLYVIYLYYIRYHDSGKAIRLRFITDRPPSPTLTILSSSQAHLIHIARRNLLLIYSHDNMLHDKCVHAFAEYLRDVFGFNVHLDVWDVSEIERNIVNYVSLSILSADKVILINSQGAYYHYRYKLQQEYRIERSESEPLDDLFEKQIDQVLGHTSVISARFKYTPYSFVLPPLSYSLQYVIPDNIAALLSNLTDSNVKNDPRIVSYSSVYEKLTNAISEMTKMLESDPNWFGNSHRRVPRLSAFDKRVRNVVHNETDKLVDSSQTEHKLEANNVGRLQLKRQMTKSSDIQRDSELITVDSSVATASFSVDAGSETLTDLPRTENFALSEKCQSNNESSKTNNYNQLNIFTVQNDDLFGKAIPCDVSTLHDSGFISEKDFRNS